MMIVEEDVTVTTREDGVGPTLRVGVRPIDEVEVGTGIGVGGGIGGGRPGRGWGGGEGGDSDGGVSEGGGVRRRG